MAAGERGNASLHPCLQHLGRIVHRREQQVGAGLAAGRFRRLDGTERHQVARGPEGIEFRIAQQQRRCLLLGASAVPVAVNDLFQHDARVGAEGIDCALQALHAGRRRLVAGDQRHMQLAVAGQRAAAHRLPHQFLGGETAGIFRVRRERTQPAAVLFARLAEFPGLRTFEGAEGQQRLDARCIGQLQHFARRQLFVHDHQVVRLFAACRDFLRQRDHLQVVALGVQHFQPDIELLRRRLHEAGDAAPVRLIGAAGVDEDDVESGGPSGRAGNG